MQIKSSLLILTSSLMLMACATPTPSTPNLSTHNPSTSPQKTPAVLATVQHLETYPDATQGNQAQLIKEDQGFCHIEFTGFYTLGKVVENWAFQNNTILSATSTKFIYSDQNLTETELQAQDLKIAQVKSHPFDITLPEKIKNFENLKQNFSQDVLKHCHS